MNLIPKKKTGNIVKRNTEIRKLELNKKPESEILQINKTPKVEFLYGRKAPNAGTKYQNITGSRNPL